MTTGFASWTVVTVSGNNGTITIDADSHLKSLLEPDKSGSHPTGFDVFTLSEDGFVSNGKFTTQANMTAYLVLHASTARTYSFIDAASNQVQLHFSLTLSDSSLASTAIASSSFDSVAVTGLSVNGSPTTSYANGVLKHDGAFAVAANANDVYFSLGFVLNSSFITSLGESTPAFVFAAEVVKP